MMTYIALAVAAVLVVIDQLTKWLAVTFIMPEGSVNLISIDDKEWLNLTYQQNTGAAFSILKDKQLFLIILTSIVILGVIILMLTKRIKKTSFIWCFSLIISGGVGNLIDRVANGYVVDFIDVRIIKFAVFNFADICAVTGTLLLVFFYILEEIRVSKEKKRKALAEGASEGNADSENDNIEASEIGLSDTLPENNGTVLENDGAKADINSGAENENAKKTDVPIKAEIRKKEEKQRDNGQA